MIPIIRYANEGFHNYVHKIKVNDVIDTEVIGCYVFFKKVFTKALRYDKFTLQCLGSDLKVKNRNKDMKNVAYMSDDVYIYARLIDIDKLDIRRTEQGIFVQPEFMGGIDPDNFSRTTVGEFSKNIQRYENLEKQLKKEAKEKNIFLEFFNIPFYFYEAIVDANDVIKKVG